MIYTRNIKLLNWKHIFFLIKLLDRLSKVSVPFDEPVSLERFRTVDSGFTTGIVSSGRLRVRESEYSRRLEFHLNEEFIRNEPVPRIKAKRRCLGGDGGLRTDGRRRGRHQIGRWNVTEPCKARIMSMREPWNNKDGYLHEENVRTRAAIRRRFIQGGKRERERETWSRFQSSLK